MHSTVARSTLHSSFRVFLQYNNHNMVTSNKSYYL